MSTSVYWRLSLFFAKSLIICNQLTAVRNIVKHLEKNMCITKWIPVEKFIKKIIVFNMNFILLTCKKQLEYVFTFKDVQYLIFSLFLFYAY